MGRIQYLDGLRGIAILLVVFYHAFSRWGELLPYGSQFSNILFEQGFLGVQLFFLISGFVILMTLDKTPSFSNFVYRRWLRLFPAMLICSVVIFISAGLFDARPNGEVQVINLVPGLLFIEPYWLEKAFGVPFQSIESAFWSLYVEFKFYVIAACLYFFIKDKILVFSLFGLFVFWVIVNILNNIAGNPIIYALFALSTHLSLSYFGWFASGACFYLFHKSQQKRWFSLGIVMAMLTAITLYFDNVTTMIFAIALSLIFAASFVISKLQIVLAHPMIVFVGFISYPLYLLHENMMISMSVQLPELIEGIPLVLAPIFAILLIGFISYLVTRYLEESTKNAIKLLIAKLSLKKLLKSPL